MAKGHLWEMSMSTGRRRTLATGPRKLHRKPFFTSVICFASMACFSQSVILVILALSPKALRRMENSPVGWHNARDLSAFDPWCGVSSEVTHEAKQRPR